VAKNNRNQELLRDIQAYLESNSIRELRELLAAIHPSEVADVLESSAKADRHEIWAHIDSNVEGEILSYANTAVRNSLVQQMEPAEVASATNLLDSDDVADILQDLPEEVADEILLSMDEQNRQRVSVVLNFPSDTAGGLMNVDAVTVRSDVDADVVLRYLRRLKAMPDNFDQLFVVDRGDVFLGVLPLTSLVLAKPRAKIKDIMATDQPVIWADSDIREVVTIFEQRDLISSPVTDRDGKLLGRITIDDVVDVIREQSDHSLMMAGGLDDESDVFAPILITTRQRSLWLAVNLGTALSAAWVIGLFEATIKELVALAVLMPIVASMGGIAGNQSLTIVLRGLVLGHVGDTNARAVIWHEVGVGILNGFIWATVVAAVSALWFDNFGLGLVIGCAMVLNLATAGLFGAAIPILLKKMNIDPALAGGVVLTTVTDIVGFLAFLGLASQFLV
jgi:magnesium transporter